MLLALLLSPTLLFAHDTSGCRPDRESHAHAALLSGATLELTYRTPAYASCAGAEQSTISVRLDFTSTHESPRVGGYFNVNGRDQTPGFSVQCRASTGGGYAKDTSQSPALRRCEATATLVTNHGPQHLRLAPEINGRYETEGYGRDLFFTLAP